MIRTCAFLIAAALPATSWALELSLPGRPVETGRIVEEQAQYALPVAIFDGEKVPLRIIDGRVEQTAYRIAGGTAPATLAKSLEQMLNDQGYSVFLRCDADRCGSFDFRFALTTLPPPQMMVDLARYSYVSAEHPDTKSAVGILISRSTDNLFVEVTQITQANADPINLGPSTNLGVGSTSADPVTLPDGTGLSLDAQLDQLGHVILTDLQFGTGSSQLSDGQYQSLVQLADFLSTNPQTTIALVGHTDATGSLAGNIALSKKRARAVRDRLLRDYSIDPNRVEAEGMGYLAPIANNRTQEGRERNRRVEAIITSTE